MKEGKVPLPEATGWLKEPEGSMLTRWLVVEVERYSERATATRLLPSSVRSRLTLFRAPALLSPVDLLPREESQGWEDDSLCRSCQWLNLMRARQQHLDASSSCIVYTPPPAATSKLLWS